MKCKTCEHNVPTWLCCEECIEDAWWKLKEERDLWKERALKKETM